MSSTEHGAGGHHSGRSHVTLQAIRSRVQPGSFPLFLVASLFLYVLNGVAFELPGRAILGRIVVAGAGLYVLSANRVTFWLAVLAGLSLISFEARVWPLGSADSEKQPGGAILLGDDADLLKSRRSTRPDAF